MNLQEGSYYWIGDSSDSYLPAQLLSNSPNVNNEYQFEDYESGQLHWVPVSLIYGPIPPPGSATLKHLYDDLVEAVDISEASILWNLRKRFENQIIYSNIGSILIAINPYCMIPGLYSTDKLNELIQHPYSKTAPHIWTITNEAYSQLKSNFKRQAIIISGESGAGKTEATKKCLQYLSAAAASSHHKGDAIEDRVLASNPVLESFGNSKTCRNNNSSRFGKWLEINFSESAGALNLIGASVIQYLLEKSRVVVQAPDERNYHIFYQLCSRGEEVGLEEAESYGYLNQSGCLEIDGVSDYEEFDETINGFRHLKFSEELMAAIFDCLRAILFLGNLEFIVEPHTDKVVPSEYGNSFGIQAAYLLGINENQLLESVSHRTIQVRGETTILPLSVEQTIDSRNALSKEIYGRLFTFIVAQANRSLSFSMSSNLENENQQRKKAGRRRLSMDGAVVHSIGLLDIFGFEIFTSNSFEQLCINYANEKLQQYFIGYVLKREQQIYDAEGIQVEKVEPIDNEDVLQLLEQKPGGLFAILDEELKLPQGSDLGFVKKIEGKYNKTSSRFVRHFKMAPDVFDIKHFAGTVQYSAVAFLEKNKDKLFDHLEVLLTQSSNEKINMIMTASNSNAPRSADTNSRNKSTETLASRFTGQLQDLIRVLNASEPHFVRCIKPNNLKLAQTFDAELVLRQLRYSGVLEAIQIRKRGYPTRRTQEEFFRSYKIISGLSLNYLQQLPNYHSRCMAIINQISSIKDIYKGIKIGKTLVFYRPEIHNALEEDKIAFGLKAVLYLQSAQRRYQATMIVNILMDARHALRKVMHEGSKLNSSNIAVIYDLESNISYCEQVGLNCFTVNEAKKLLERLLLVKECVAAMKPLLSKGDSYEKVDILEEFGTIARHLHKAIDLGIQNDIVTQLETKHKRMSSRVDVIHSLRQAVHDLNEADIEVNLAKIASLSEEYGSFCAHEANEAFQLKEKLKSEREILQDIVNIIQLSQRELQQQCSTTPDAPLTTSLNSVADVLDKSCRELSEQLEHFDESSLSSELIIMSKNTIQSFLVLRLKWLEDNWSDLTATVNSLRNYSNSLSNYYGETSSVKRSTVAIICCETLPSLIMIEFSLVSTGIDRNVLSPILKQGLDDCHHSHELFLSPESISDAVLPDVIDNLTKLGISTFPIQMPGLKLLTLVNLLSKLFRYLKSDDYMNVLAFSESQVESKSRLAFVERFQTDLDTSLVDETRLLSDDIDAIVNILVTDLHIEILNQIRDKFFGARWYGVDKFIQFVLLTTLKSPRIIVEEENRKIDMSQSLTLMLQDSLSFVNKYWESQLSLLQKYPSVTMTMITISIISEIERLINLRQLLQDCHYDDILEKYNIGQSILSPTILDTANDTIKDCLSQVQGEVDTMITDAHNLRLLNFFRESMKVGAVTGSIGNINVDEIQYHHLDDLIQEAQIGFDAYSGSFSSEKLKKMCKIASILIDCRKSFQSSNSEQKIQSVRRLETFKNELPGELIEEFSLLISEVEYWCSIEMLETSLKLPHGKAYCVFKNGDPKADYQIDADLLSTTQLQEGIDIAQALSDRYGSSLSSYFDNLLKCSELVVEIRKSVTCQDWELVVELGAKIRTNYFENVPIVAYEVDELCKLAATETFVSCFVNFLKHGLSSVEFEKGGVNAGNHQMNSSKIDSALLDAEKISSPTNKLRYLTRGTYVMKTLRSFFLEGHWAKAKELLQSENDLLADEFLESCHEEIKLMNVVLKNVEYVSLLKDCLSSELIKGFPGDVNTAAVEINQLSAAVDTINNNIDVPYGAHLLALLAAAEIILKARKATKQTQWSIARNYSSSWNEALTSLKELLQKHTELFSAINSHQVGTNMLFMYEKNDPFLSELFDELNLVQNHITTIQLEAEVSRALIENGVSAEMVGKIDLSKIRTDSLEAVLERKLNLEKSTNLRLAPSVEKLCQAAELILKIRRAILSGKWEIIPSLVEEAFMGTYHPLPEACRQELQVIRFEHENRYIISTISEALQSGKLKGSVDDALSIKDVKCHELSSAITACRAMTARTEEALSILRTADEILCLRLLLTEETIIWPKVREVALQLLSKPFATSDDNSLHRIGLEEIRLTFSIADNTIFCQNLESALRKGGPTGIAGDLSVEEIHVDHLRAVIKDAAKLTVQSKKAVQLVNASKSIIQLREAVQKLQDAASREETLSMIKEVISEMYEKKKRIPNDHGWKICQAEVGLILKHSHLLQVQDKFEESVQDACKAYNARAASNFSRQISRKGESDFSVKSLDEIISYIEKLQFESTRLDNYYVCAQYLRTTRNHVIDEEWAAAKAFVSNPQLDMLMEPVPSALTELNLARQEIHNKITALLLEEVLQAPSTNDPQQERLTQVINDAEASKISATSTQQLLDCAKRVLSLRIGLSKDDQQQVAAALRWFANNVLRCPQKVRDEAERAHILHQNSMLFAGLTAALQTGTATGTLGNMNLLTIDTSALSNLLLQAEDIRHQTDKVREIVRVSEMILSLRSAQKAKDYNGISRSLQAIASWEHSLPPIVIEEVANAKAEHDNYCSVKAMRDSLISFTCRPIQALFLALRSVKIDNSNASIIETIIENFNSGDNKSLRDYFKDQIEFSFLNVDGLKDALEVVREYGIFTNEARRLHHTVTTLQRVRLAISENNWDVVKEKIIYCNSKLFDSAASKELNMIQGVYFLHCSIQNLITSLKGGWARCSNGLVDTRLLEVHSFNDAINGVESNLKQIGFQMHDKKAYKYTTNLGKSTQDSPVIQAPVKSVINISMIPVSSPSLKKFRKQFSKKVALHDLDQDQPPIFPKVSSDNVEVIVQNHFEKLLLSANIVIDVRKLLLEGDIQSAGEIAEQAIKDGVHVSVQGELQHYATEIGLALHFIRVCKQLRTAITTGNSDLLETALKTSKEINLLSTGDLGLIRTLDRAVEFFGEVVKARKALVNVINSFSIENIQASIDHAKSLKISGYLLENANLRLNTLNQFQTSLNDLFSSVNGTSSRNGIISGRQVHQLITEMGTTVGLKNHPATRRAMVVLHLSDVGVIVNDICQGLLSGSSFAVTTMTIKLKLLYFKQPGIMEFYALEKFPRLRSSWEYCIRHGMESQELKTNMLTHTDMPIHTSLTKLNPLLATVAVSIFRHIIQVIELNFSPHQDVLIRNLIFMARCSPILRDEILLQIVKQLRDNPNHSRAKRLFVLLNYCLRHFPPSDQFENYLERFLLDLLSTSSLAEVDYSTLIMDCIRQLHESIFQYGYNLKISCLHWDCSLPTIRSTFQNLEGTFATSSSGTNGMSKRLREKRQCDPAFMERGVPYHEVPKINLVCTLRNSLQDWTSRVQKMTKNGTISFSDFSQTMTSPAHLDEIDSFVFQFWIDLCNEGIVDVSTKYLESSKKEISLNRLRDDYQNDLYGISFDQTTLNLQQQCTSKLRAIFHDLVITKRVDKSEDKFQNFWKIVMTQLVLFYHSCSPSPQQKGVNASSNCTLDMFCYRLIVRSGIDIIVNELHCHLPPQGEIVLSYDEADIYHDVFIESVEYYH